MRNHYEQAENSVFFQQLDICCQKIAAQVGEKQILEWTNSDYIKLGRLLSRKTKVQLSESTLKRIFGKSRTSERYYPQKATRDALAQFIGYRDWYEFEFRHTAQIVHQKVIPKIIEHLPEKKKTKNSATWLMLASLLGLAFILTLIVQKPANKDHSAINDVKLVCVNPIGSIPHSAIFKLQGKGESVDSLGNFSIQFGDGKIKRTSLTGLMLNHYYEAPGRYYPLLFYKNKVIDSAYVYLQTEGWAVTGENPTDTTRVYPVSIPGFDTKKKLFITAKAASHAGIDTLHTFFISFTNAKPTQINGDNFEFSAQLKTSANRIGVRCSQVDISIYGEKDKHAFSIIRPECTVWTRYHFSENMKDGNQDDLRAFGHDLSKGGMLKLHIKNKVVNLFINNKPVYNTQYEKSIGRVMGVKILFSGLGSFEKFGLKDLKTNEKF